MKLLFATLLCVIGVVIGFYLGSLTYKELADYQQQQFEKLNKCEETHKECILVAVPKLPWSKP